MNEIKVPKIPREGGGGENIARESTGISMNFLTLTDSVAY